MATLSKAKPEYLSMTLTREESSDIKKLASLLGVKKATAAKVVIRAHIKAMIDRLIEKLNLREPEGD